MYRFTAILSFVHLDLVFVDQDGNVTAFAAAEVTDDLPAAHPNHIRIITSWNVDFDCVFYRIFNDGVSLISDDLKRNIGFSLGFVDDRDADIRIILWRQRSVGEDAVCG